MKRIGASGLFVLALLGGGPAAPGAMDPRHIEAGSKIPDESYCDQPYVVITKDGNWLCTLTTGAKHEGSGGQHFVATISKDQGKSWGPLIDIEPADGPEASYGVPLIVPSGRVYAFYTYNGDRVRSLPGSIRKIRADMLGWYCFRFSVDGGPDLITFVVDGKLCDGGASRQFGWGRFDAKAGDINGSNTLRLAPSFDGKIQGLRIYDRHLRTSEAIANWRAAAEGSPRP